jgi:hypothetical protein
VGDIGTIVHFSEPVTDVEPEGTISESYQLSQNYPNPFNPSTKIKYTLTTSSFVTIKVYNLLGNEIVTLVNGIKPAGTFEVDFNASEIPSGIYFYKLEAGNFLSGSGESFVHTKKMMLLK